MTKIISWNVNGVRAITRSGFMDWLQETKPDIVCLQETKAHPEDLPEEILAPKGYMSLWNPAQKKGYSGTGAYVRKDPNRVYTMGDPEYDDEGRVQVIEYDNFTILNGYWPNSQDKRARLPYKLSFVDAISQFACDLVSRGKNVILCGDFNIAHKEIDLARPKDNQNCAGFYKEEREAMQKFIDCGFVDSFRHFNQYPGHYTWWSYRSGARERNVGWRIDYHCVNKDFADRLKDATILCEVHGSDHCPVGITLKK